MPDKKISDLTSITGANTASGDLFTVVDVSDSSMAASGTNKKITRDELKTGLGVVAASTSTAGIVQLTDSISSTSTSTAATPNSVKSAYDLANAAIAKSLVNAKGDLIVATANDTPASQAVGADGTLLVADSSQSSGIAWAKAAGNPGWSGAWQSIGQAGAAGGNQYAEAIIRLTPYVLTTARTIDAVAIRIGTSGTGSTGAVVRIGIWNAGADGLPGTLLKDFGTVDATVAAGSVCQISSINLAISPGIYWWGAATQGGATTRPYIQDTGETNMTPFAGSTLALETGANATTASFANFSVFMARTAASTYTGAFGSLAGVGLTLTGIAHRIVWRFA